MSELPVQAPEQPERVLALPLGLALASRLARGQRREKTLQPLEQFLAGTFSGPPGRAYARDGA